MPEETSQGTILVMSNNGTVFIVIGNGHAILSAPMTAQSAREFGQAVMDAANDIAAGLREKEHGQDGDQARNAPAQTACTPKGENSI